MGESWDSSVVSPIMHVFLCDKSLPLGVPKHQAFSSPPWGAAVSDSNQAERLVASILSWDWASRMVVGGALWKVIVPIRTECGLAKQLCHQSESSLKGRDLQSDLDANPNNRRVSSVD
jgi:hypothetical protein